MRRFDLVLANPPFSRGSWGQPDWRQGDHFGRDAYGRPPRSNGDFAYVLHVVASLRESGRAVMVLPPGILYRGGAEGRIREELIRDDLVDAIVSLPARLFARTTTPVVLLTLDRGRPMSRRGKVLLVDGASAFPGQLRRNILSDEQVARLVGAVHRYTDEDGLSRVVPINEIAANGFDLSLAQYLRSSEAPAVSVPPRPLASRLLANPAVAEARATLEEAQRRKAQRAAELFTRGVVGAEMLATWAGELPAHWSFRRLRDCLEVPLRNGPFIPKGDGTITIMQIGQTAIAANSLVDLRAVERKPVRAPPQEWDRLLPGDVLLKRVHANLNEVATAALVAEIPDGPLFCESSITRLRVRGDLISPEILLAWLHQAPVRSIIAGVARRSIQASINHNGLSSLPCPYIPDAEERMVINAELVELTQAIHAARRRLAIIEASGYDAEK